MITLLSNEKKEEFLNSFDEDNKKIISSCFKFLFIENNDLYFSLEANEDEKIILRKIWSTIRSNALFHLEIKNLNMVNKEDEKILFLQKAIELFNIKDVKIHL